MSEGVFAHWPNRITALRFVGAVGLFVILALGGEREMAEIEADPGLIPAAFWVFLAVALSDILDGWLARRGHWITAFGRIADPFVDKVLVLGSMTFLAVLPWSRERFPAWLVVVVMAREFLITGVRGYAESVGVQFPADWFGKVKMLVQCWAVGIVIGLAAFHFPPQAERFWGAAADLCVLGTLLTSVGSGLSYVVRARRLFSGAAR